jgi:hypothetical protein
LEEKVVTKYRMKCVEREIDPVDSPCGSSGKAAMMGGGDEGGSLPGCYDCGSLTHKRGSPNCVRKDELLSTQTPQYLRDKKAAGTLSSGRGGGGGGGSAKRNICYKCQNGSCRMIPPHVAKIAGGIM